MRFELEGGRHELKYVVPVEMRRDILAFAEPHVRPDHNGNPLPTGASGYLVHSVYFDTEILDDYGDRLAERRVRNRIRVRTYGRSGERQAVFVENKRKYEDRVIKARVLIGHADEYTVLRVPYPWQWFTDRVPADDKLAFRNFDRLASRRRAVSAVHYMREVYCARASDQPKTRLTFDLDVQGRVRPAPWALYGEPEVDLLPRDLCVMEMKFEGREPQWMRELCARFRLRAEPVSKFGLSVACGIRADHPREQRYFLPRTLRRGHSRTVTPAPALQVIR